MPSLLGPPSKLFVSVFIKNLKPSTFCTQLKRLGNELLVILSILETTNIIYRFSFYAPIHFLTEKKRDKKNVLGHKSLLVSVFVVE